MAEQIALIFHGLGDPRDDLPEEEKPYWISADAFAEIVALIADRRARGVGREVVVTLDDSNLSDLQAADMLAQHGLTGEFFLLSERFGREHYLTREDARSLVDMGMVVGSHGHAHLDWRQTDDATLHQELAVARRLIADAIGRPVTRAAIPFGSYDKRVVSALRAEGFERVYNSDLGPTTADARFARRTCIMRHHDIAAVEAILDDRVPLSAKLRRTIAPVVKGLR